MRVKIRAEHGITEPSMAGYRRKILRRERDLLILTGGMWNENKKITGCRRYAENYDSNQVMINILSGAGLRDWGKKGGGMRD